MKKIIIFLLIAVFFQLSASQRYVIGEVFTNDPDC